MVALDFSSLFLPALISTLFRSRMEPFPVSPPLLDTYDYIIVGSGPGGSVVANRLSEDPNKSVLLLEAGTKDNVTSQIPFLAFILLTHGYDWNYKTTPQKRCCLGNYDNKCNIASGKVIGGSSGIDFMSHRRGMKEDYDRWESQGNIGWSYEELLPFFKKSEDYRINGSCIETDQHNCEGELVITEIDKEREHRACKHFVKAAKELFGFKEIGYQEPVQPGILRGTFRIRNGIRQSASTSFLRPIMKRQNLHVSLESFVRKILIDPDTKSAVGVEFEKEGVIKQIKAKREVILSAGAHSSPKILMLSGIGPIRQLSKFKIPVIVNLPGVGQNLRERVGVPVFFATEMSLLEDEFITPKAIRKWYKGKGILSTPDGFDVEVLLRNYSDKEANVVDLTLRLQTVMFNELMAPLLERISNARTELYRIVIDHLANRNALNIQSILLRPKSKGTVTLGSNDPNDYPIIEPNFYSEEIDLKSQIAGMNTIYKIINSTTFQEQGYKYIPINFSLCERYEINSDEYLECLIKYHSIPFHGSCCTNKMGPDTDKMAVVDHRLRVHGVKKLRVVDSSVMPEPVTGTLVPTVVMIGEKAAAMIIEDNKM